VEQQRPELLRLCLKIHDNPELSFSEERAAAWLSAYLEKNGLSVERDIAGLATAFRGSYGEGEPRLAIIAEYDALPEIGHACGHNIIATAAVGAGVAAKPVVDALGGSVIVLGTPGEEAFAGKVDMVEAGVFNGIDAAMMVHPDVSNVATVVSLACVSLDIEFVGKAAHAAANPYGGVNALEAMILGFGALNSLRQHMKQEARVHGIITDGGEAPNTVPAHSAAKLLVRALDDGYLNELKERVLDCFAGAAISTGATMQYSWGEKVIAPMRNNLALAELFRRNLEALGRRVEFDNPGANLFSTDMGNVSQVVPSIHPTVAIASPGTLIHSLEFASAAASEAGYLGALDAAKAMAMTVVDILARPDMIATIREEFHHG